MTLAAAALVVAGSATNTQAGAHSWRVSEAFSNADGTIWFVEIWEYAGGDVERGISGANVVSVNTAQLIDITTNIPLTEGTAKKFYLFGNQAFADLPGSPPLDQLVPGNARFSFAQGERLRYSISGATFDLIFPAALPTNGINSFHLDTTIGTGGAVSSVVNSPTNFAGDTGTVDASGGGGSGETALLLNKTVGATVDVILSWGASCEAGDTAFGVYRGTLVSLRSGVYDHASVTCGLAATTTTLAELAAIPGEYYLVVPASASTEGSYGRSRSAGTLTERPDVNMALTRTALILTAR